MQEEIEIEPVGMRDVERERERGENRREERKDKNRERERERDSWLHHISLAVVECALTVYPASVVVQCR